MLGGRTYRWDPWQDGRDTRNRRRQQYRRHRSYKFPIRIIIVGVQEVTTHIGSAYKSDVRPEERMSETIYSPRRQTSSS